MVREISSTLRNTPQARPFLTAKSLTNLSGTGHAQTVGQWHFRLLQF
jgi:hypothetical protein